MAGSPKKRARRLALEAAKAEALRNAPTASHTIPSGPEIQWTEPPSPRAPKEADIDVLVASVMPHEAGAAGTVDGILDATKHQLYNELVGLALERALDIMRIKPGDELYDKQVLTRQVSIIASALTTTARINEAQLKGRGRDRVKELLDELRKSKPGFN